MSSPVTTHDPDHWDEQSESVRRLLDASQLGAAIPPERRAEIEEVLASDPVIRELMEHR
ncbi:MAG: hypothetical protein U0Q16_32835 [Bryobacteraceae bacterium]